LVLFHVAAKCWISVQIKSILYKTKNIETKSKPTDNELKIME